MKRQTNSKEKIKSAFVSLISNIGFEKLTITDITRQAHINRGTFYLHYKDKYDLIDSLESDIINDLEKIFIQEVEVTGKDLTDLISYKITLKSIGYLKDNFDLIKALYVAEGESKFMLSLRNILEKLLFIKLAGSTNLNFPKTNIPIEYSIELLLYSIISIISLWIRRDGKESPIEIANIINASKNIAPIDLLTK
ncbi:TetR/AcrR family transcriptional regulator [Peptoniphilus sp.]|uniref:TetR/AcrR family transcriptional regulator n=1 Tax=Peptoniphilus sp. TaxID=1971214 RepID=UPI002A81B21D|nr:TetR/AcrR family transcriptional regulator [Peptoniphilus sp.]MDY3902580.1 TetR/AcrR family transcriptional regulator [Peptoniphilus sp.]